MPNQKTQVDVKKNVNGSAKNSLNVYLLDKLKEDGFLTEDDSIKLKNAVAKKHQDVQIALVQGGFMEDENLGRYIADLNNWHFISLQTQPIDKKVTFKIPEMVARAQGVLAFKEDKHHVHVGMKNPSDLNFIHLLEKRYGKQVKPYFITSRDLLLSLSVYKSDIQKEFHEILESLALNKKSEHKDQIAVKIIDMLISRGFDSGASDIHIEPFEKETFVRFRIDGVLQDIIVIPKEHHDILISRIKVMANLRTDEHQIPQDGKLKYRLSDEYVDVRVSIVPTTKGENGVLRLLADKSRQLSFKQLGFSDQDYQKLKRNIAKPWGMILATGPTGSGKTTNLYAILKRLNKRQVHIATIEDPVEYNLDGVTQIQVNNKAELTFASGLRSIVRQDPDIIMVGEIRDKETANIAVNSAMTGHLVLSTLHTNDAATTIPRLLDMGVEPFLIASTVNIAIGQRLIRKICPKCIVSYSVSKEELAEEVPKDVVEKLMGEKETHILFKGAGCELCHDTGYYGRTGIFEVLEVDASIKDLIMKNADADQIKAQAVANGMTTMFDDAKDKVLNGVTTVEELIRVVRD